MQTGEFTQAKGQEVMESFLKSYDDIDVVVAENDNMAFGAIDAIKQPAKPADLTATSSSSPSTQLRQHLTP